MRGGSRFALSVVLPLLAAALTFTIAQADGPTDEHVRQIARQVQCPVCPGEAVANSEAELAKQMRAFIREKLAEGWSDEQILQYYVDRYGEAILLNPPKRGFATLIWLGAAVAVGLGLLVVGSTLVDVLRRKADDRPPPVSAMSNDERGRYAARLDRILQGDERG